MSTASAHDVAVLKVHDKASVQDVRAISFQWRKASTGVPVL
jgi:hypothetical protein